MTDGGGVEHLGVVIMRERAQSVGARLELRSEPVHGTEVVAWFPVESV